MRPRPTRLLILGLAALFVFSFLGVVAEGDEQPEVVVNCEGLEDIEFVDDPSEYLPEDPTDPDIPIVVDEDKLDEIKDQLPGNQNKQKEEDGKEEQEPGFSGDPGENFKDGLSTGNSRNAKLAGKAGQGFMDNVAAPVQKGLQKLPSIGKGAGSALEDVGGSLGAILDGNPFQGGEQRSIGFALNDVQVVAVASTGILFLLGAVLGGSSSSKATAVMVPFVPLYSRIKREQVFKHERREHLYQLVGTNPGISFNHLKVMMNLENGALRHHLLTLEREHYIKSVKDGKKRRFYLNGRKVSPLSRTQQQILHYIRDNPNISQSEIAILMKVSRQNISYHIRKMEKERILRVRQDDANPHFELFERRF